MTAVASPERPAEAVSAHPERLGLLGRLGRWTADHVRAVAITRTVVALGLGFFCPRVETALSGAGWQANGSESVQARELIEASFGGLSSSALMVVLHSDGQTASEPGFRRAIERVEQILRADEHVALYSGLVPARASPPTATPQSCSPAPRATRRRWSLLRTSLRRS